MTRLLPYPLLSLCLALMWLLLQGSFTFGAGLFALLIGLLMPLSMRAFQPEQPRIRNPGAILRLFAIVLVDVVRSNLAVATIILSRRARARVSGFIHVPLDIRSRYGLSALAIVLTCTPGTLWVEYDASRSRLLLHVLDLVDEQEWIQQIKGRYERLLMEIFE